MKLYTEARYKVEYRKIDELNKPNEKQEF